MQMNEYQNTILWKKMIENDHKEECEFLCVEYKKFRENASVLASEISSILPDYTVHDITHIDALWDMVDIFLPADYPISPAECFVLGGAFILHDLGMVIAAYPEGMHGIQKESIWRDTVANLAKQRDMVYDFEKPDGIDKKICQIATEKTLRMLHAQKANDLAKMSWKNSQGKDIFLIDDQRLRDAYGTVIGQIAQSHWWDCEDLPKNFPTVLGALSDFSKSWTVDPLKLACIIRIADAMHIDDRRAPSLLNATRNISKLSKLHWLFQEKLYKPRIEHHRVVYTSKSPFSLQEMDAWWLCHDTLKMIDNELKNVDALLLECQRKSFDLVGVYAIDHLDQIQKQITVDGWKPVDTRIRVNNVARLVSTLGGLQLYGNNYIVPLRELIQNAADAIRARRYMDDEADDYGDIYLSWGKEDGEEFIQIEDNGVGMSQNVLVNVLLDFGQSFWGTEQMHNEFPGLEQKSFQSTGQFGIGFFSVFMWGKHIKVISNRYDKARDNTAVLEFMAGINSRPVLRKANPDEVIKNGGTRIKIWLSEKCISEIFETDFRMDVSIDETISRLCFSLDCNIYTTNEGKKKLVSANDWLTLSEEEFLYRLFGKKHLNEFIKEKRRGYELICKNIRMMREEDGSVVGRGCICNRWMLHNISGLVTVDGLETTGLFGIAGILKGTTKRASRDVAIPIASKYAIDKWVEEQDQLFASSKVDIEDQLEISHLACTLSSKVISLKIAKWKDNYVNYHEIVEIVKRQDCHQYYIVQDAAVNNYEREKNLKIDLAHNVFACAAGCPVIIQTEGLYRFVDWPDPPQMETSSYSSVNVIYKRVLEAISEAWGCSFDSIVKAGQFSDDDKRYSVVIGHIDDINVEMDVDIVNFIEN